MLHTPQYDAAVLSYAVFTCKGHVHGASGLHDHSLGCRSSLQPPRDARGQGSLARLTSSKAREPFLKLCPPASEEIV